MSTVDLSERDNKETLFVKEEVTNDAEVFGEVKVDVEGSQKELLALVTATQPNNGRPIFSPCRSIHPPYGIAPWVSLSGIFSLDLLRPLHAAQSLKEGEKGRVYASGQ